MTDEHMTETEPKTDTRPTIQFRVTPEEYAALEKAAKADDRKIGTFVRLIALRAIAQNATKTGQGEVAVSEQAQS